MKVTPQDIKDSGFFSEMFGKMDAAAFDAFLTGAIGAQAAILSARIGAGLYASTDTTLAECVLQAEKHLTIAEMWQRRIARKLGQAQSGDVSCKYEVEARDRAREEAEDWVFRITGGDFASGVCESDPLDGTDA